MEDPKHENVFKLHQLIAEATKYFADIFKEKYRKKFNSEWKDNKQSANEFKKSSEKIRIELKRIELKNFDNGKTSEWDLTLLGKVLTSSVFKDSDSKWINDIIGIRNKVAHFSDLCISNKTFEDLYVKYSKAMTSLGYSAEKLNKLKLDMSQREKAILNISSNEIEKIKKMANEEIHKKNYLKAIELYSNALVSFDNITSQQKADLYYERSLANLLHYDNLNNCDEKYLHRSLLDAKQSNLFEPRWSKTYSHIGDIYHKLNELEDSIHYFEKALALDVGNEEIKNTLALIKSKKNQQDRCEHMNSNFFPGTIEENGSILFKKTFGKIGLSSKITGYIQSSKCRDNLKDIIGKYDPSFLDVCKGLT